MNKIFTIGLVSMVGFVLTSVIASALPTLTITGFTADGTAMTGDINNGFTLITGGVASTHHQISFADGSVASSPLKADNFGLYLTGANDSVKNELKSYYDNRAELSGLQPFKDYLNAAVDGKNPFAFIHGDGETTSITLLDAAKLDLLSQSSPMDIPDDFPLGTYTVTGQIQDTTPSDPNGTVTFMLIVAGPSRCSVAASDFSFSTLKPGTISPSDESTTITFSGNAAPVDLAVQGGPWSDVGGHNMQVGQTKWSLASGQDYSTMTALTDSGVSLGKIPNPGDSFPVYFKLGIPGGQFPATYTQTVTFTAGC